MKIYIAASEHCSDLTRENEIATFIKKFRTVAHEDFVVEDPDIIWFISGGSEHDALKEVSSHKRYCLVANSKDNSWASAIEVKALLNEKGINTRIFDFDKIDNLAPLENYINYAGGDKHFRLGLIGKPADWLVASVPDYDLIMEVLNIEIVEFTHEELLAAEPVSENLSYKKAFGKLNYNFDTETEILSAKISKIVDDNTLDAVALECFSLIKNSDYTPCLALAALNTAAIPAICEGDLCSAAGMISLFRLNGKIPWMANLIHLNREYATFAHCTVPLNMLDHFCIDTHFESRKGAAIRGELKKQLVTVFRLDRKLENCFLALGEIVGTDDSNSACRTQAKIKMSIKSLFLLKEFPLGNHHLIVEGDHTDTLAEYFTNKGFRIV